MPRIATGRLRIARSLLFPVHIAALGAVGCLLLAGCSHADQVTPASAPSPSDTGVAPMVPPTTVPPTTVPPTTVASDDCGPLSTDVGPSSAPTTIPIGTTWVEHTVVAGTCPQVLDLAAGAAFSLVSETFNDQGPWQLERIDIDRATTESGPTFDYRTLAIAGGYLWIACGQALDDPSSPQLCQVDPASLAIVDQLPLPPPKDPLSGGYGLVVTGGPGDTVWVGCEQTLVHIDVGDRAILSTVPLDSGTIDDLSVDPGSNYLYVSVENPTISGQPVDAAVDEVDARTGRTLVETSANSAVTESAGAGALSAVPGGVWTSFRTGMRGETILLRQSDLAMVGPPRADLDVPFPDSVFVWMMGASTIYGGDALFVVNQNGILACVDPSTGAVRAQEHLINAEGTDSQLLAVDAVSGRLFATDGGGVQAITPPPVCWR